MTAKWLPEAIEKQFAAVPTRFELSVSRCSRLFCTIRFLVSRPRIFSLVHTQILNIFHFLHSILRLEDQAYMVWSLCSTLSQFTKSVICMAVIHTPPSTKLRIHCRREIMLQKQRLLSPLPAKDSLGREGNKEEPDECSRDFHLAVVQGEVKLAPIPKSMPPAFQWGWDWRGAASLRRLCKMTAY